MTGKAQRLTYHEATALALLVAARHLRSPNGYLDWEDIWPVARTDPPHQVADLIRTQALTLYDALHAYEQLHDVDAREIYERTTQ